MLLFCLIWYLGAGVIRQRDHCPDIQNDASAFHVIMLCACNLPAARTVLGGLDCERWASGFRPGRWEYYTALLHIVYTANGISASQAQQKLVGIGSPVRPV